MCFLIVELIEVFKKESQEGVKEQMTPLVEFSR